MIENKDCQYEQSKETLTTERSKKKIVMFEKPIQRNAQSARRTISCKQNDVKEKQKDVNVFCRRETMNYHKNFINLSFDKDKKVKLGCIHTQYSRLGSKKNTMQQVSCQEKIAKYVEMQRLSSFKNKLKSRKTINFNDYKNGGQVYTQLYSDYLIQENQRTIDRAKQLEIKTAENQDEVINLMWELEDSQDEIQEKMDGIQTRDRAKMKNLGLDINFGNKQGKHVVKKQKTIVEFANTCKKCNMGKICKIHQFHRQHGQNLANLKEDRLKTMKKVQQVIDRKKIEQTKKVLGKNQMFRRLGVAYQKGGPKFDLEYDHSNIDSDSDNDNCDHYKT